MWSNLKFFISHPQYRSIGLIFWLNAVLFTFWATRLPDVKAQLGLGEGALGWALFFLPLGALLAMLCSSLIINKYGTGLVTIRSAILFCFVIIGPMLAWNLFSLSLFLFIAGFAGGLLDIAMNAVTANLEKQDKVVIMSTCHGFFSLGGMVGAGLSSLMIWAGIRPLTEMIFGAICMLLLIAISLKKHIIENKETIQNNDHKLAIPGKGLIGLAIIGFCTMQGEGAIADWSAIFLKEVVLSEPVWVAMGYAGFSLCMTLGRFYGDQIIAHFGPWPVLLVGSLLAILGMGLVMVSITGWTILGFSIAGLGYSCMIPVIFSEAAKKSKTSAAQGIAAVATAAYGGFLLGPVLIGFLGEHFGLQKGFLYLLVLAILSLLISRISLPKTN